MPIGGFGARFQTGISIAALLAGVSWGQEASAQAASGAVEEITVTARKRSENIQDIPVTVQAFSEDQLDDLNVVDFEDYARFAPSVSFTTQGPGQTKLVIRGVAESTGTRTGQSSAAIYLDEQPLTSNSLTPDPRIVDVERIEILPGPQGTLYGASSQSGTLKIVTNKPKTDLFESFFEATGASVTDGGQSYDVNGMVNIPIVKDKLAVRVVGFYGEEAGYIDNVLGTTPGGTVDNAAFVKDDVNRQKEYGGRVAVRWDASERLTITGSYVFQDTNLKGTSAFDPSVGDLKTVRFFDEFFKDDWEQYAATINADLGFADLVVTSALYNRQIRSINDNTAYMQFLTGLAVAYPAYYAFYDFGPDPLGFYDFRLNEDRMSHEVRLSSKSGSRWSWLVGAFYEKIDGDTVAGANIIDYPLTPSFASVAAYLSAPTDIYFFQRVAYDQDQVAVFGEVSVDLTDRLTATLGGRYFDSNNDGSIVTDIPEGLNIEQSILTAPEDGFTPKVGLSYQVTDNALAYFIYSEGFRLGGANRDRPGLAVPQQYEADKLTNYEIGAKTEWFDGRLVLNAAAYQMSWDDFQLEVRNPDPSTFYFVIANVGQAEVNGFELEVAARPFSGLTIGGAGTILSSELSEPSAFLAAPAGTRLPVTPQVKYALYGDYSFPVGAFGAMGYVRGDISHTGSSVNSVDPASSLTLDAYTLANFQIGFDREALTVNLYVNNAFDERAELYISPAVYDSSVTPNRPREIGITITQQF